MGAPLQGEEQPHRAGLGPKKSNSKLSMQTLLGGMRIRLVHTSTAACIVKTQQGRGELTGIQNSAR
jgi:hypothetical protein